jgi:hypothetical protein
MRGMLRPMTTSPSSPWSGRHPSVAHFEPLFSFAHLPRPLQVISIPFAELARVLLRELDDGRELSVALRKLLEAKDAAVRQAVLDGRLGERSS